MSAQNIEIVDAGFEKENVLSFSVGVGVGVGLVTQNANVVLLNRSDKSLIKLKN